jgi:signal transduction histidine kinase
MLDHLGLPVAIEWQANEFSKRTGIPCRITVKPEDMQLNADLSTAVFRIFQETLTNVSRHAEAKRVEVSLKLSCGEIRLVVKDNGKGITEEQMAKPDSFGLLGIRERVSYWGGAVKITGKQGKGTTVSIRIPYRRRSDSV